MSTNVNGNTRTDEEMSAAHSLATMASTAATSSAIRDIPSWGRLTSPREEWKAFDFFCTVSFFFLSLSSVLGF